MIRGVSTARLEETSPDPVHVDQRITLYDATWEDYERLLELRGESSNPRLTYLEGVLELMSPSLPHEDQKKTLARLVEAWSEELGIPLEGIGSWTLKKREAEPGAEPDECYRRGEGRRNEFPDFVIEVIWTHGGLDKRHVYFRLWIREVWYWKRGTLTFHVRRGSRYVRSDRSEVVPELDPELIARCMAEPTQLAAVRAIRAAAKEQKGE